VCRDLELRVAAAGLVGAGESRGVATHGGHRKLDLEEQVMRRSSETVQPGRLRAQVRHIAAARARQPCAECEKHDQRREVPHREEAQAARTLVEARLHERPKAVDEHADSIDQQHVRADPP
jgi:hypothetical protein